jgi:hypothetical protein
MSIYDVDFIKVGNRILPPDKRFKGMTAWVKAILSPFQWIRDLWLGSYRTGSTDQDWLSSTTYAKYNRVVYTIYVYESLKDGNNDAPTNPDSWFIVQNNFIGLSERLMYNTSEVVLEYAINKRFETTFRQPNNQSDIFFISHEPPSSVFVIGGSESNSSKVFSGGSSEYIINSYSFVSFFNLTLNIPSAVYAGINPIPANAEKIIRSFVDMYIAAGITYEIVTY